MSEEIQDQNTTQETSEISPEEALRVLQAKGQENLESCKQEIAAALDKYGFTLEAAHVVQIVPVKKQ